VELELGTAAVIVVWDLVLRSGVGWTPIDLLLRPNSEQVGVANPQAAQPAPFTSTGGLLGSFRVTLNCSQVLYVYTARSVV